MVESIASSQIGTSIGGSTYMNSIVRSSVKKSPQVKFRKLQIGLVGNASVGKTSLIRKFIKGDEIDGRSTRTTIGVERTSL